MRALRTSTIYPPKQQTNKQTTAAAAATTTTTTTCFILLIISSHYLCAEHRTATGRAASRSGVLGVKALHHRMWDAPPPNEARHLPLLPWLNERKKPLYIGVAQCCHVERKFTYFIVYKSYSIYYIYQFPVVLVIIVFKYIRPVTNSSEFHTKNNLSKTEPICLTCVEVEAFFRALFFLLLYSNKKVNNGIPIENKCVRANRRGQSK